MRKLKKWRIVPTGVSSMRIEGRCAKTGAFVTTGDIQRRISNCRVVAAGGVCYRLSGYMDWNAGFEANLPPHILDSFMYGVPRQWKRIIYGWLPSAPGKRILGSSTRKVKRRSSSRHGRPRVSVPGASCNDSELDGHRKYELCGEQTEQRSLSCGGPGRGDMSDNGAAEMRKESQLLLNNPRVILEPLPAFLGFRGYIEKSANAPVSVESRPIRCSTRAGSVNQKRCTDCNEALVVPGMSSLSKQKENHGQSTARVKTNDAPVLVAEGAALSEVASCSWAQPQAPDFLKLGGQGTKTMAAPEAVQQGAIQRRAMKDCTEKHNGSAAQNKPTRSHSIRKSVNALGEVGELEPVSPRSSQMYDLGQVSKFTAGDQVLAVKAQKAVRTENAEQTVQRKPKRGRPKKGSEVQKPVPMDGKNMQELASEAGPSKNRASHVATRPKKGGKVQKPARAKTACESTPQAGPSRTPASNAGQAPKPSALTAALLAVTAGKGTKRRKAQVKQLTEALAARDECDDMYAGAPPNIVCDFVDKDPWAEMRDLRVSGMRTPTPNSPHVSPSKSCFSFSSNSSGAMSPPPPFANAILQGIKGRKPPLPSSTPKLAQGKKHLSVSAVTKGLRELGEEMDRDKIHANCAESSNESWDSDSSLL